MADNVIGSVAVEIVGDAAPLIATLTAIPQKAQAAGAQIAAGVNTATAPVANLTAEFDRLIAAIQQGRDDDGAPARGGGRV